jgi:TDG/mug DNA glycosylase family protein
VLGSVDKTGASRHAKVRGLPRLTLAPDLHVSSKPDAAALRAAATRKLPDILAPNLSLLLVGINPGMYSAAIGHHFGRPGNRFWKVLAASGLTPKLLTPYDDHTLPQYGLGLTNVVGRTTARAEELALTELRQGARKLERKVAKCAPRVVAVLGVTAYRTAFARPKAQLGLQAEQLADAKLWILPNPSGLNAHHQLPDLTRLFAELRAFAFAR